MAGSTSSFRRDDDEAVVWAISPGVTPYLEAVAAMQSRAAAIADGAALEMVWLLEHPALYTAGVSAKRADLLAPTRFPVFESGRGGQFTYHGPGQRVIYVMLDLRCRGRDTRAFIGALEAWIIATLASLDVQARTMTGRVGVWTGSPDDEAKVAAVGVRLRGWVSFHGVSLNVDPDLEHFSGIVPCGIANAGVTSLRRLGSAAEPATVDAALRSAFGQIFGPSIAGPPPL